MEEKIVENNEINKENTEINEVTTKEVKEEVEKKARKAKTYTKEEMYTAGTKDGSKLLTSVSLAADIALSKINKTEKARAQFISDAIVSYAIQKFGEDIEREINQKLEKESTSIGQMEKIMTKVMLLMLSKPKKSIQTTIAKMVLNLQRNTKFKKLIANLGIEEKCERLSKKFGTDKEDKVLWAIALWYVEHGVVDPIVEDIINSIDNDDDEWDDD